MDTDLYPRMDVHRGYLTDVALRTADVDREIAQAQLHAPERATEAACQRCGLAPVVQKTPALFPGSTRSVTGVEDVTRANPYTGQPIRMRMCGPCRAATQDLV